MSLNPCLTLYTKIFPKELIDLVAIDKIIKCLEENIGINFCKDLLDILQEMHKNIDKLDFIKIKKFSSSKNTASIFKSRGITLPTKVRLVKAIPSCSEQGLLSTVRRFLTVVASLAVEHDL